MAVAVAMFMFCVIDVAVELCIAYPLFMFVEAAFDIGPHAQLITTVGVASCLKKSLVGAFLAYIHACETRRHAPPPSPPPKH